MEMTTGEISPIGRVNSNFLFLSGALFCLAVYSLNGLVDWVLILPLAALLAVTVYYFEALIVLQLVSVVLATLPGLDVLFEAEPNIQHIRVSVIALLALFTVELIQRRKRVRLWTACSMRLSLFFMVLIGLTLWQITDFSLTGTDKYWLVGLFQLVNGPILMFPVGFLLQYSSERSRRSIWILWFALLFLGIALFMVNMEDILHGTVRGLLVDETGGVVLSIAISRLMGAGAVISSIFLLKSKRGLLKLGTAAGGGLFLALMVLANERGPVVAYFLIIVLMFWINRQFLSNRVRGVILVSTVLAIGAFGYLQLNPVSDRYYQTVQIGFGEEARWQFFSEALRTIATNWAGMGYGGFAAATGIGYVHNLFLESLTEGGPLGFGLLVWFLLSLYRAARLVFRDGLEGEVVVYLLAFYFLNTQVSGSFVGNTDFFFFAGVIAGKAAVGHDPANEHSDRKQTAKPETSIIRGFRGESVAPDAVETHSQRSLS
jgi:hypothetical protein